MKNKILNLALLIALSFSLGFTQPASAQPVAVGPETWYVSSALGDDSNICNAVGTPCKTINSAIAQLANGDTVKVAAGSYSKIGVSLHSLDPEVVYINKDIEIYGGWDETFTSQIGTSILDGIHLRGGLTIDSAHVAMDGFEVTNGHDNENADSSSGIYISDTGALTLSNSKIYGNANNITNINSIYNYGGGINNYGNLVLSNVDISGNSANYGGGVYNEGDLTLNNVDISGNSANYGGGIYNRGNLVMDNVEISENTYWFHGGGVYNNGSMTVNNTTISHNSLQSTNFMGGNGVYNTGAAISITNSTISSNLGVDGGGIVSYNGTVEIENSTIVYNQSFGVWGNLSLHNSILAENNQDCLGNIVSLGYNLVGNIGYCPTLKAPGDFFGTNINKLLPLLSPLQNNGGFAKTHILYSNSPALNAGDPLSCPSVDQRGASRPLDGICDIGAVEGSIPAVTPLAKTPAGVVIKKSLTFRWGTVPAATKYRIQIKGGSKSITYTIPAGSCSETKCAFTPHLKFEISHRYKWNVQAFVNGVWQVKSPFKNFLVSAGKPGKWKGGNVVFYVNKSATAITDFVITFDVRGCGTRKFTKAKIPINLKKENFSFDIITIKMEGSFITPTRAAGTLKLIRYLQFKGCSSASGDFPWTAVWKSYSQSKDLLMKRSIFDLPVLNE